MFVFDPLTQGLELLAKRDLQRAESLFLRVINDPYVQEEELDQARTYLKDIRSCQAGDRSLDFERYKKLSRKTTLSLDKIYDLLADLYFSDCETYEQFDEEIAQQIPAVINKLKQIKVGDIITRDKLFQKIEKSSLAAIKKRLPKGKVNGKAGGGVDLYRWKTLYRKFVEFINPILLERHLELLEYILETGEISLLDDPKLTVLTSKYRWIIESTRKSKWYLLRSYFFKARSEIESQFSKKEGTRKYGISRSSFISTNSITRPWRKFISLLNPWN